LGNTVQIEQDDLSRPENIETIENREKWSSEKRAEDPLFFATYPDFVTFAPDGPLRQITIQQIRSLREQSQLTPLRGSHRVFLVDHLDRANEQAANSLLKVFEEPPPHLTIIATTENLYDLLPTIRSRSVILPMCRLSDEEMTAFVRTRGLPDTQARIDLAEGSPGIAVTLDIEQLRNRRALVLAAFECGAGITPFATWVQQSEAFNASRSEKLEIYLKLAYGVLRDILHVWHGQKPVTHGDVGPRLWQIAEKITLPWIERATSQIDELLVMVRRNIQKTAALDALVMNLRNPSPRPST
jgi:DNA polymerase III subunit delta'